MRELVEENVTLYCNLKIRHELNIPNLMSYKKRTFCLLMCLVQVCIQLFHVENKST